MTEQPLYTLDQARAWLSEQLREKGATCPCCGQMAKVYKRKINANMVRSLILGYQAAGMGWFHAPSVARDRGEMSKLRYWELVEEEQALRLDGGRAGFWRLTQLGQLFVLGLVSVAAHALIYDSKLLRLDESSGKVNIHEALGARFNYQELMKAKLPEMSGS